MNQTADAAPARGTLIGKLFGAEAIPGTRVQSILLAMALSVMPIALLLYGNRGAIDGVAPILQVAGGALIVAVFATALLSKFLAPHVAGAIVGAFGYGFFSMSWLPEETGPATLIFLWAATSFLGSLILTWLLSNSKVVVSSAALVATGLVIFLGAGADLSPPDSSSAAPPEALSFSSPPAETPNIYLFILDGFGRLDIIEDQFAAAGEELDLSASVDALEDLGFVQGPVASTNYVESIISIPSMLNGTLHHLPEAPLNDLELWEVGRPAIQGDNFLINSLKAAGYSYWHSGSVIWDASSCNPDVADLCLGPDTKGLESQVSVWSLTPARHFVGMVDFADISDPASVIPTILEARASQPNDEPYVVFSHIVSPHQPYRFEEDCSLRSQRGIGTSIAIGHLPEHRPLYADQAHCLAEQLEETMTDLIEADPTAIILLQGDHGPLFELDQETFEWNDSAIRERVGVFRMTRLPEQCRSDNPWAQSLVNTPELILSCLSGEEPDWVTPRVFLLGRGGTIIEAEQPLVEAN